jgi:hypothetical protein
VRVSKDEGRLTLRDAATPLISGCLSRSRDGDCSPAELTSLCSLTMGKAPVFPWLGISLSLRLWLWESLPGVEPGPARGRSNGGLTPCIWSVRRIGAEFLFVGRRCGHEPEPGVLLATVKRR